MIPKIYSSLSYFFLFGVTRKKAGMRNENSRSALLKTVNNHSYRKYLLDFLKSLFQILNKILYIFYTYREANRIFLNSLL